MMTLNIVGRLGADAVLGDANGTPVLNMSVACDGWDPKAREKSTTWVRVAFFGTRAEKVAQYLSKGSWVSCSGEPRLTEYKGKMYLELSASQVTMVGNKPAETRAEPQQRKAAKPAVDDDPFG
jgi:single-stranded DNA-binding protein